MAHVKVFLVILCSSLWTLVALVWSFWRYSLFSCCHPWTVARVWRRQVWEDPFFCSVKAEKSSQTGPMKMSPWSAPCSYNCLCYPLALGGFNFIFKALFKKCNFYFVYFRFFHILSGQIKNLFIYLLPILAVIDFYCMCKLEMSRVHFASFVKCKNCK